MTWPVWTWPTDSMKVFKNMWLAVKFHVVNALWHGKVRQRSCVELFVVKQNPKDFELQTEHTLVKLEVGASVSNQTMNSCVSLDDITHMCSIAPKALRKCYIRLHLNSTYCLLLVLRLAMLQQRMNVTDVFHFYKLVTQLPSLPSPKHVWFVQCCILALQFLGHLQWVEVVLVNGPESMQMSTLISHESTGIMNLILLNGGKSIPLLFV